MAQPVGCPVAGLGAIVATRYCVAPDRHELIATWGTAKATWRQPSQLCRSVLTPASRERRHGRATRRRASGRRQRDNHLKEHPGQTRPGPTHPSPLGSLLLRKAKLRHAVARNLVQPQPLSPSTPAKSAGSPAMNRHGTGSNSSMAAATGSTHPSPSTTCTQSR